MDQHFSLNSEDGTIECHTCGKQLASNASLIDHHRTHTGERPYACTICNKRFTQKAHLIIHKRTHTGEKPYACAICHKRFAQSSHLKNHKRIHTGEKAYLCSICNMGFSRKPRLEQHLEEHALHEALISKSKKITAEKEMKTTLANMKTEKIPAEEVEDMTVGISHNRRASQTVSHTTGNTVSRKRKPAFVTRVRQSDSDMSHFEGEEETDVCRERIHAKVVTGLCIKFEPVDEHEKLQQNSFTVKNESSACVFQRSMRTLSSGTPESDGQGGHEASAIGCAVDFSTPRSCNDLMDAQSPEFKCNEDGSSVCDVSSSEPQVSILHDEGDMASITSESNNSSPEQTTTHISGSSHTTQSRKRNFFFRSLHNNGGFTRIKNGSRTGSLSYWQPGINRQKSDMASSTYCRTNKRICLIDFSTEDLIAHLMARDAVLRCDYCCIIFQDPAMYHLHRSMHDKADIRCCNICGKQSGDKYDFVAHYLCEHK